MLKKLLEESIPCPRNCKPCHNDADLYFMGTGCINRTTPLREFIMRIYNRIKKAIF